METVKEKLVRILDDYWEVTMTVEDVADVLIGNGVTIPEWVSVEERLPEYDEEVLAWCYWYEKYQTLKCHYSSHLKGRWFTTVAGQEVYSVTHWMPLPQPPKGVHHA